MCEDEYADGADPSAGQQSAVPSLAPPPQRTARNWFGLL